MIDLADVVGSVLKRVTGLAGRHRIALFLPSDLPMVTGDFVLLEQVLFNLMDNAAKYAPPDTAISLTARADEDSVVLEVMDEGPGIPEEALETIFAKFKRLEDGDRRRAGTGLGLAISRGFVEAMGGTIVARNRLDRSGAVFRISLPVAVMPPALSEDQLAMQER